ncbi:MAG: ABC transporter substrate-binding protein [Rhodobacteraceae bacterium]|nr:ABC transporter substrate-binding protein [Paracoccaceae bacterium]
MKTLRGNAALAAAVALVAGTAEAETTLSVLLDGNADTNAMMEALAAAFTARNPDITLELENRPGGSEGDNVVKTRLATGEAGDIIQYNSGSLFQALNPVSTLADLTDLPAQDNILDSFKSVVTAPDGTVRGIPFGPAMGGGVYYNIPLYEELGLSIPRTWDEFMANNAKVAEAGRVPVATTFGDTWTSQLFVLGDFYNVLAEVPTFAEDYTANRAKFATTPAALRGFEHLQEIFEAGYMNRDFGVATFEDGMRMVATGEAAHYPMLTFAMATVRQNTPEHIDDLGYFALPGPSADRNGLTVWMPAALYIPAASQNIEAARKFLDFVASPEGCRIMIEAVGATGPYLIEGCELPADVPRSVADMLPYFEQDGRTAPALEFLSPIKGPALEQITVEVGSGIRSAAEGAALYDQDVEKQARQLGLPNW